MNRITIRIANALCALMLVLYPPVMLLSLVIQAASSAHILSLPTGLLLSLSLILPSVVLLIGGIVRIGKGGGVLQPVLWAASLLSGLVWAGQTLFSWAFALHLHQVMLGLVAPVFHIPLGTLLAINEYGTFAIWLLQAVIALAMLIIFVVLVATSKQKWHGLKAGMCLCSSSVMILIPLLFSIAQFLLNRLVAPMLGMAAFSAFTTVYGLVMLAVNLLLSLLFVVCLLTFGLIFKKQKAPADIEAAPVQENFAQQVDLPAGVSAADM